MSARPQVVRVPRAWGNGGEGMVEAASMPLPFPEALRVEEPSLARQVAELERRTPDRPLVLGGCCCSHVGPVGALAARHDRLGVVWLDAHGDLNTPETSPSGNEWGMPLRMIIDAGAVAAEDVVLVGARNLDPPEEEFIAASGVRTGAGAIAEVAGRVDAIYVAFDADVLAASEVDCFMPEPGGPTLAEAEEVLRSVAEAAPVAGAGMTGFIASAENPARIVRLCAALGLGD